MAKKTVKLDDWIAYLSERVNVDLYVWGGNDELVVNLLDKLCNLEKSKEDVDRVLTLLQKRLLQGCDILKIRCDDCSGLAVGFLLKYGIIKNDMTADGLYKLIGKKIKLNEVKAGDYLFMGSDSKKTHVGYAIDAKRAIESKNHDEGVVMTVIANRGWKYAARPDWYDEKQPQPVVPSLERELSFRTTSLMQGNDVKKVQESLNNLGYNCGTSDGYFGKKTDIAVRNFQSDRGLTVDGVVGKHTAESLGFLWKG